MGLSRIPVRIHPGPMSQLDTATIRRFLWGAIFLLVFIWSAISPKDYPTWFLEVLPAVIAFIVLAVTEKKFPLTPLCFLLILIHCVILMIGGHYTYAEVPFFDWTRELSSMGRNNYDKLGHFAQGFIPTLVAREILLRKSVINGRKWMNFLIVCFVLAFSAFYELIEWAVASFSKEAADAFLGTQGYTWDTQSDMALALLGAVLALTVLSKIHDKQLLSRGYIK